MKKIILKLENLSKSFKSIVLFKNINLEILENSVVAITGKNGSGKTTLLKMLCGLTLPDDGNIIIDNLNFAKHRTKIKNFVRVVINPEKGFYPNLTLQENLNIFYRFYSKNAYQIDTWIKNFSIQNFFNTKFINCSNGIKQKFTLLTTLINKPKLVLIDELTKSVDTETLCSIYDFINYLNSIGTTIIFVTHNFNEIKILNAQHYHINNYILEKKSYVKIY